MSITQTTHGHEIIHLIRDADPGLTRAALASEVAARFGPRARFHTCSTDSLSLDELLNFLMSRGKVIERDGRLEARMGEVCGDGQ